ncbi:2'-5' RNA ligase family protein [Streptomyces sp. NPDC001404]|uniref:2'-5' RNA ligase family protein n=1 Tax=Streptomyces sp. NPDC001404 TaxID=3364571 RepID=UPI003687E038
MAQHPALATDQSVFPAVPPAVLDDPDVIALHDWEAFTAVDRMVNHWDRPGWENGRRAYYWLLTFPRATALINRAGYCQDALRHLEMDAVPHDGLHVTLPRIGPVDRVRATDLERLAAAVHERALPAFHLDAHPLAGSRGAVRFSLAPWTPLVHLHAELSAAAHGIGLAPSKPTAGFRPHLGILYSNTPRDARPVIDAAAALRALPLVPLYVDTVDLVELRRDGRTYRWTILHSVPLAPATP